MNQTTTEWPCPECGTMIADTGMSSKLGLEDSGHPRKQHATCPNCKLPLVRFPDGPGGLDKAWRDDRSPIERESDADE